MRRFAVTLLLPLALVLAWSGIKQSADSSDTAVSEKLAYFSDTLPEVCYLCRDSVESLEAPYWGQNNIALICLNTFKIKDVHSTKLMQNLLHITS